MAFFEDIEAGDELPPLQKSFHPARMMAYGAATWDFIRLHYDVDYVKEQGFEAPFVDGQMLGGILAQQVQDWAGPDAFLRRLSFRNRSMLFAGDSVTCRGTVARKFEEDGEGLVECQLWVEKPNGDRVVEPASAVVRVPRKG